MGGHTRSIGLSANICNALVSGYFVLLSYLRTCTRHITVGGGAGGWHSGQQFILDVHANTTRAASVHCLHYIGYIGGFAKPLSLPFKRGCLLKTVHPKLPFLERPFWEWPHWKTTFVRKTAVHGWEPFWKRGFGNTRVWETLVLRPDVSGMSPYWRTWQC